MAKGTAATAERAADGAVGAGGVLDRRSRNRALLARQGLLQRWDIPAAEAIARLVGLQSQSPTAPYVGLWTRLERFDTEDLATLIRDGNAVRIALMRSTIHLVTADDCLALHPVLQAMLEQAFHTGTPYGKRLAGMDLGEVVAAGRRMLASKPRTVEELGRLLQERWPDRDAKALGYAMRNLAPLVQLPPRGLWGLGGLPICAMAESWLRRSFKTETAPDALILRYLAGFGPASVQDMQLWSGMPRLQEVAERLRPRLLSFRDEQGRELFDLPEAPRPPADTPAPPRFLPEFDNLILSHADRDHVIAAADRPRIISNTVLPTLLVDGFIHGTWRIAQQRGHATLVVAPFAPLTKKTTAAVDREGARLLDFAAESAASREVKITPPG